MPGDHNNLPTLSVQQLHVMQQDNAHHHLVDVREPSEYTKGNIGGELIPLSQIPERLDYLRSIKKPLLLLCKAGGRSARATAFLLENGVDEAYNVEGGLLAWKEAIDPNLAL